MEKGPDPVTVEIVRNAILACTLEMKIDLRRTAYSPIINEMNDFSVAIFDATAQTVAQAPGLPEFVCDIPSAIHSIADDIGGIDRFQHGDVYLTNDPYANTLHVHDVNAVKPIFVGDRLIGFSAARAHWHDIGGSSASGSMTATEIFQEGLILRSVALYRAGELNGDVMRIIAGNTRLPESVLGDIRAQVGACSVGERRVLAVVSRYGLPTYQACVDQILADGERLALEALVGIPNGVYKAESCIDNDGVELDKPISVRVTVEKSDGKLTIDLAGSTESCVGSMNCNRNTTRSICRLVFKMLTTPTEPANDGHFRMVEVRIPDRSIFNAKRPSATFPGFTLLETLEDAVMRALASAAPNRINADDYGRCTPAHIKFRDSQSGYSILADTEGGGWGGSARSDGESALGLGEIRTIPIEIMEARYPVLLRRYALRDDSGGPGKYRGGLGIIKDYECLVDAELNAIYERQVCPPAGVLGGHDAASNRILVVDPDGHAKLLPSKITDYPIRAGQVISFQTAGGGGFGDPAERSLDLVEDDIRQRYVTSASALSTAYAVVLHDGHIDAAGTERVRASGRSGTQAAP